MPWTVEVPGKYLGDQVAYLDIETRKVPCSWAFPDGTPLRRRWSAFMVGIGTRGRITILESIGNETALLAGVREVLGEADTIHYLGTRKFDEMVLKGRFTYARRGPAEVPFYPSVPGAEELTWDAHRELPEPWRSVRERELDSRYVPEVYERDPNLVLIHNLRDVAWLIGAYGEPDATCAAWLRKVLTDLTYADAVLNT